MKNPPVARALLLLAVLTSISLQAGSTLATPACRDLFAIVEGPLGKTFYQARPGAASAVSVVLRLGPGRVIHSQILQPATPDRPTLLLMPGSNRAFTTLDRGFQQLAAQGFGIATLNTSVHPFSIASLPTGERPAFYRNEPRLEDFAAEAQFLADHLRTAYGLRHIIPVSLSYSGGFSPLLRGFPVIIETAPMTSTAAANPTLGSYYESLKLGAAFNPFFGPSLMRDALDTAYRQVWVPQADAISKEFRLPAERTEDIVEGYVRLSRASEGFDWKNLAISREARRVFIIGANEATTLRRHQVETFKRVRATRDDALLFVIEGADHVIPETQPVAYALAFELLASGRLDGQSGVVIVSPTTNSEVPRFNFRTGAEADQAIEVLLR